MKLLIKDEEQLKKILEDYIYTLEKEIYENIKLADKLKKILKDIGD